jgi:hypothetical protein
LIDGDDWLAKHLGQTARRCAAIQLHLP